MTIDSYLAFKESEGYAAYDQGVKTYIASLGLKAAITDAEAFSVDAAAALAVYTNTASTADEMVNATNTLNEIIAVKKALKAAIEE